MCMLLSGQVVESKKENNDLMCFKGRDVWLSIIKGATVIQKCKSVCAVLSWQSMERKE